MPSASRSPRTPSKCSRQASQSDSPIFGASSSAARSTGFFTSNTCSGLVARLWRASSSSTSSCASSHSFKPANVRGPAVRIADRVQVELPLGHAEPAQKLSVEADHLGVDLRAGRADRLERELPVLAVAAAARRAVAVHRRDRVRLHRLRPAVQAALEVGADDRRRALGPERERAVGAVGERVHLLVHDVRGLAGGAREQAGVLEPGRLDPAPAVVGGLLLHHADDVPPAVVVRQDVVRPARRLELRRSRPELAEERIRLELAAERRRVAVAGIDDRIAAVAVDEPLDRGESVAPVAAGEVDPADRAREEQIAREDAPCRCRRRRGRSSGPGSRRPRTRARRPRRRRRRAPRARDRAAAPRVPPRVSPSRSACASPAGAQTSAPVASASAATPATWSTSEWVTRIPATVPPSRSSSARSGAGSPPGSTTAPEAPRPRRGRSSSSSRICGLRTTRVTETGTRSSLETQNDAAQRLLPGRDGLVRRGCLRSQRR